MEDLFNRIQDICQDYAAGVYESRARKYKCLSRVGEVPLDLEFVRNQFPPDMLPQSDVPLSLDIFEGKTEKEKINMFENCLLVPMPTFLILSLLKDVKSDEVEEIISRLLSQDISRWLGLACFRLYPSKTDNVYYAVFRAGIHIDDRSDCKWYIKSCVRYKGILGVMHDIRDVILSDTVSDSDIEGAFFAIYWTGVNNLPALRDYDRYKAAPQKTIRTHIEQFEKKIKKLKKDFLPKVLDAGEIEEAKRTIVQKFALYDKVKREDIIEARDIQIDILNRAIDIFLDETKPHNLRKEAFLHIPVLRKSNRYAQLPEKIKIQIKKVKEAARRFPDESVQQLART